MAHILLNEKDAANHLALSVHTLRRWRVLGHGPRFLKIGTKAVRYAVADLEDFMHGRMAPQRKGA
jgi:predicted DNA-binding transcriptional regulator AlpA